MPARSKQQFKYIWALRNKYKSKKKAPESKKWAFNKEWTDVNYNQLPKKSKKIKENHILLFEEFGFKNLFKWIPSPIDQVADEEDRLADEEDREADEEDRISDFEDDFNQEEDDTLNLPIIQNIKLINEIITECISHFCLTNKFEYRVFYDKRYHKEWNKPGENKKIKQFKIQISLGNFKATNDMENEYKNCISHLKYSLKKEFDIIQFSSTVHKGNNFHDIANKKINYRFKIIDISVIYID